MHTHTLSRVDNCSYNFYLTKILVQLCGQQKLFTCGHLVNESCIVVATWSVTVVVVIIWSVKIIYFWSFSQ